MAAFPASGINYDEKGLYEYFFFCLEFKKPKFSEIIFNCVFSSGERETEFFLLPVCQSMYFVLPEMRTKEAKYVPILNYCLYIL